MINDITFKTGITVVHDYVLYKTFGEDKYIDKFALIV